MNTFNGEEVAGRKILVREDREDRDVKQYNKENGIERPDTARPPRRARRGGGDGGPPGHGSSGEGRPPRREARGPAPGADNGETGIEPSGLQVRAGCCSTPSFPIPARASKVACPIMTLPDVEKVGEACPGQGERS